MTGFCTRFVLVNTSTTSKPKNAPEHIFMRLKSCVEQEILDP